MPTRIVGIHPREKLQEAICPVDDAQLAIEFKYHFAIQPWIVVANVVDRSVNMTEVRGIAVAMDLNMFRATIRIIFRLHN